MKHTEYIIPIGEEAKDFDEIFIGVIRKHKELIRCKDCKYDHECTHVMVRKSKGGGNIFCPVFYCSEGKRKEK